MNITLGTSRRNMRADDARVGRIAQRRRGAERGQVSGRRLLEPKRLYALLPLRLCASAREIPHPALLSIAALFLLALFTAPTRVVAEASEFTGAGDPPLATATDPALGRGVVLSLELVNVLLWRNDADFDRSAPHYDADGQGVGVLGTVLKPMVTWNIREELSIVYEAEIGLNIWSLNNPDQQDATADDVFLMKHRELYTRGSFADGLFGFKVGYQRLQDPTRLFIDHWIGAADLSSNLGATTLHLQAGQISDGTYEGFRVEENNFVHDSFVYGLFASTPLGDFVTLSSGVYGLIDDQVVGKTNRVATPLVNVEADLDLLVVGVDAALQVGAFEGGATGGGDQSHFAWAAQLYGQAQLRALFLKWNVLALSADDADPGNDMNGAFHYSAKSRSSTLLFTESELHDSFDNLDEKIGARQGGFVLPRAGLLLADLMVGYDVLPWLRPLLIVGYGQALNPDNALGATVYGVELDAGAQLRLDDVLEFLLVGSAFLPGQAMAANVNELDRGATDPIYSLTSVLKVFY